MLRVVCILGVVLPGAQLTYLRGGLLGGMGVVGNYDFDSLIVKFGALLRGQPHSPNVLHYPLLLNFHLRVTFLLPFYILSL